MYVVYEHWLDDKCFCVGSGNLKRPKAFGCRKRAWQEYVGDRRKDIEVKVIKEFETKEEAYNYEIEHHKEMVAKGHPIQNLLGNASYWAGKKRPDIGTKVSKALKGRHLTEEHRKHISENNTRANKGKPMSEESRRKLSESMKQKFATDEVYRQKHKSSQQKRWR